MYPADRKLLNNVQVRSSLSSVCWQSPAIETVHSPLTDWQTRCRIGVGQIKRAPDTRLSLVWQPLSTRHWLSALSDWNIATVAVTTNCYFMFCAADFHCVQCLIGLTVGKRASEVANDAPWRVLNEPLSKARTHARKSTRRPSALFSYLQSRRLQIWEQWSLISQLHRLFPSTKPKQ